MAAFLACTGFADAARAIPLGTITETSTADVYDLTFTADSSITSLTFQLPTTLDTVPPEALVWDWVFQVTTTDNSGGAPVPDITTIDAFRPNGTSPFTLNNPAPMDLGNALLPLSIPDKPSVLVFTFNTGTFNEGDVFTLSSFTVNTIGGSTISIEDLDGLQVTVLSSGGVTDIYEYVWDGAQFNVAPRIPLPPALPLLLTGAALLYGVRRYRRA